MGSDHDSTQPNDGHRGQRPDDAKASAARLKDLLAEALDLPETDRHAFLANACGADRELFNQAESLLRAAQASGFLKSPTASFVADLPPSESAGGKIGPYKLLQQIGEGGFGAVFMAEQTEPIRRRVALKVIKLGMDTRQVVARFEQERQALAVMDHPNIAKVFDAGATESGRPYFVMELVKGQPITEYCDRQGLSIPERLELFSQVCHAVQHAHTKGVIHRDIKPRNVLVSTHDGKPLVKVIDFGIAKATDQRMTEKTLFTEHQAMIGTPEYMSPEQAEGSLDIDTRTDVYALGVLLYELLTGATPFDGKSLREAGYGEICRIIREVDPPRPSLRVSTKAQAAWAGGSVSGSSSSAKSSTPQQIVSVRRTEPGQLFGILKGDLDWVVMKALEKDRARRYATPTTLAEDVARYLAGEAVTAVPPSRWYRVRKFVRRNRTGVVAGAISVMAATLITILWLHSASSGRVAAFAEARLQATRSVAEVDAYAAVLRGAAVARSEGRVADARQQLDSIAEIALSFEHRFENALIAETPFPEFRETLLAFSSGGSKALVSSGNDVVIVDLQTMSEEARIGNLRLTHGLGWDFGIAEDALCLVAVNREQSTYEIWDTRAQACLDRRTGTGFGLLLNVLGTYYDDLTTLPTTSLVLNGEGNFALGRERIYKLPGFEPIEWQYSAPGNAAISARVTGDGESLAVVRQDGTLLFRNLGSRTDRVLRRSGVRGIDTLSRDGKWIVTREVDDGFAIRSTSTGSLGFGMRDDVLPPVPPMLIGDRFALITVAGALELRSDDGELLGAVPSDHPAARGWDPSFWSSALADPAVGRRGWLECYDLASPVTGSVADLPAIPACGPEFVASHIWHLSWKGEQQRLQARRVADGATTASAQLVSAIALNMRGSALLTLHPDALLTFDPMRIDRFPVSGFIANVLLGAASAEGERLVAINQDSLQIIDADGLHERLRVDHSGATTRAVALNATGELLAILDASGDLSLRSALDNTVLARGSVSAEFASASPRCAIGSDGSIAVANGRGDVVVFARSNDQLTERTRTSVSGGAVTAIVAVPARKEFLLGMRDGSTHVVDEVSLAVRVTLPTNGHAIGAMTPSFDGLRYFTASDDGSIRIWHSETGKELLTLNEERITAAPTAIFIEPNNERLVVGYANGAERVWDAVTWAERVRRRGKPEWPNTEPKLVPVGSRAGH